MLTAKALARVRSIAVWLTETIRGTHHAIGDISLTEVWRFRHVHEVVIRGIVSTAVEADQSGRILFLPNFDGATVLEAEVSANVTYLGDLCVAGLDGAGPGESVASTLLVGPVYGLQMMELRNIVMNESWVSTIM